MKDNRKYNSVRGEVYENILYTLLGLTILGSGLGLYHAEKGLYHAGKEATKPVKGFVREINNDGRDDSVLYNAKGDICGIFIQQPDGRLVKLEDLETSATKSLSQNLTDEYNSIRQKAEEYVK